MGYRGGSGGRPGGGRSSGVIFEFVAIGAYVKVSAIDEATNTEVSIVGNPALGETALKRTALRKLDYVLSKNNNAGQKSGRR